MHIVALDTHYMADAAVTAAVAFSSWSDAAASHSWTVRTSPIADYTSGAFYKRELPCVLQALQCTTLPADIVVVDGYVWLGAGRPGLGWHVYDALNRDGGKEVAVVGVAKNPFVDNAVARAVCRGGSKKPLYVTAAGMDVDDAAACVVRMHGAHRHPTLLKVVDRLCRDAAGADPTAGADDVIDAGSVCPTGKSRGP